MPVGNLKKLGLRIGTVQIPVQPTKPVLQPFRVATVATVGRSTALVTPVTGGVLLRAVPVTPGTGTCTTIAAMSTDSTAIRSWGFLSVA